MKKYIQNWKKVYKFEEFGDYENFFIELCYVANKRDFKSSLLAPLTNKIAQNGKPIFANENIDFTKYVLLNERIEEQTNELMFVYETYGYAPADAYVDYIAEPVQMFGVVDTSGAKTSKVKSAEYYTPTTSEKKIKLTIETPDDFNLGDSVVIKIARAYAVDNLYSPNLIIQEKLSDKYLIVDNFNFINADKNDLVVQDKTAVRLINEFASICTIEKSASARLPANRIANVKQVHTFSVGFPQLESKFIVSSGTGETDTITTGTSPNLSEWKQLIVNGDYINTQDSVVEVVYPKTFYKKTQKKTLAK